MRVPGSNLLNMALRVIARQTVSYFVFTGRVLNSYGQDIPTYADPIQITGSFQAVPRQLYEKYGLDLQKTYYTFYSSTNIIDVGRDTAGDQLSFNNQRFQVESGNDWFATDGWKGVLCVALDKAGN